MVGFMNRCVPPFVDDGTNTVHPSHVVGIIEHFDAPPTRERLLTTFLVHTTDDRDQVVRCLGGYGLLTIGHNIVKGPYIIYSLAIVVTIQQFKCKEYR
jgi:hypothetical protein